MIYLALISSILAVSPLDPLLEKMQNTIFMSGSFTQTDLWALTLEEEISSGIMYIAHPDLFLLKYTDPQGAGTGYDGSYFYTIEPDIQQVIIYPGREPGNFLHMIEKCADSSAAETLEYNNDSLLVLLEGDFGEGIIRMKVGYSISDSLPFLFGTTDVNGNSTSYQMWDITIDNNIPDNIFNMVIPDGYSVVNPGEI
ncbi:MAG: outer-membrane lipoprotein carrier protein LolA [Candidatus Fermentibacteraceae bacterium]|nr:outer-membrane lipoprotein carrier protein LolA [Candidatus Fermentibacteraceae bacterium]